MTDRYTEAQAISIITETAESILDQALASRGRATIALSGGQTPKLYLPPLFSLPLEWANVQIILADERWVDPIDNRSNEHLVNTLRQGTMASNADVMSLWSCGGTPEEAAHKASSIAAEQKMQIDLAVLGIGGDSHIASLFPNDDAVTSKDPYWVAVKAPSEPNVPLDRLSLSPVALLNAKQSLLIYSGSKKHQAWVDACDASSTLRTHPAGLLRDHRSLVVIHIQDP